MASDNYDYESFDSSDHSMKEIADAIRRKGYGKDVREAIAQGMDQYDKTSGELFKRMDKLEKQVDSLNKKIDQLNQRCKKLEDSRATHEEVQGAKDEWKTKIEHVALGTDYGTIEKVVDQILIKKGLI